MFREGVDKEAGYNTLKVRYAMMVSPVEERQRNAKEIQKIIPELELIEVDGSKTELWNAHLEIMRTDPNVYDGVVIMEDDIKLCRNFRERFDSVLLEHPRDIVQFFERALAKKPLKRGWQNG